MNLIKAKRKSKEEYALLLLVYLKVPNTVP